jgi:hypothetical protein
MSWPVSLYKKQDRWQVVARSDRGHWTTGGLVPGRYRLEVAGLITEDGELQPLSGPQVQDIKLKDGHAASVAVVVNRTSTAVKVLIVATIVLVRHLGSGRDLRWRRLRRGCRRGADRNRPDPEASHHLSGPLAGPSRQVLSGPTACRRIIVDRAGAGLRGSEDEADEEDQPVVQDYYPAARVDPDCAGCRYPAGVRPAHVRLDPLPEHHLRLRQQSGEITRGVDYFDDRFVAVIDPLRDFKPGETVTVSIDGGGIASDDGEVLGKSYRFTFHVAGPPHPQRRGRALRAAEYDRYGDSSVLVVRETSAAVPRGDQILVRVRAAALNPKDILVRKGKYRFFSGRKFPQRVGYDWAGEAIKIGTKSEFDSGQKLFGMINAWTAGACAELVAVQPDECAPMPPG